jgi:hypothetical protein
MNAQRVIEVPLPEGAQPTPEDMELLQAAFRAIVDLRYPGRRHWEAVRDGLEREGWSVRCTLAWHVESRRGREMEEACGKTRDEAFDRISQTTRVASLEGCP